MPLSTEELIQAIESNQLTIMFLLRDHINEQILHNSGNEQDRFGKALEKFPPNYLNEHVENFYNTKNSWAAEENCKFSMFQYFQVKFA
jgi:hypothetical protein